MAHSLGAASAPSRVRRVVGRAPLEEWHSGLFFKNYGSAGQGGPSDLGRYEAWPRKRHLESAGSPSTLCRRGDLSAERRLPTTIRRLPWRIGSSSSSL